MRSSDAALPLLALLAVACNGSTMGPSGSSGTGGGNPDADLVALSVNGVHCGGAAAYVNEPCVTVEVCAPGSTQCRTIDGVLLDTGSYGLRLFRQALGGLSLTQVTAAGGAVATCVQFGDRSSDWGPVQLADVVLGGEPSVRVAIQVIDATFATPPASCPGPEASPEVAGFNGILGVGPFVEDCGPGCAAAADNGIYFACGGAGCAGTTMPVAQQIQDPVALLPLDGNGVVIDLPAVDAGGAPSVEGTLFLGLGTRANNGMPGAIPFPLDPSDGTFTTTLEGAVLPRSFLDTGSNGFFFDPPVPGELPPCSGSPWFCPTSPVSFQASNTGFGGSPSAMVGFQVGDFDALFATPNQVFPDIAGSGIAGAGFDWGLPFHLGRRVAVGFDSRSSTLGAGPLVAY